jgi:hypothetical protein
MYPAGAGGKGVPDAASSLAEVLAGIGEGAAADAPATGCKMYPAGAGGKVWSPDDGVAVREEDAAMSWRCLSNESPLPDRRVLRLSGSKLAWR